MAIRGQAHCFLPGDRVAAGILKHNVAGSSSEKVQEAGGWTSGRFDSSYPWLRGIVRIEFLKSAASTPRRCNWEQKKE